MARLTALSALIGVCSGLASIYAVPAEWEVGLWAVLIAVIGVVVARGEGPPFRRGFLLAVLAGAGITLTHLALLGDYLRSHPGEESWLSANGWLPSARLVLAAMAPVYWAVFGLLAGLASVAWRKALKGRAAR